MLSQALNLIAYYNYTFMKRNKLTQAISFLLLMVSFTAFGFSGGDDHGTYVLDGASSVISWEGHKFFGGKHTGTINLSEGQFDVQDGKLVGGQFTIDMHSIKVTDLQGDPAEKLAAHLKTDDFFDAAHYPTATFVISHVEYAGANQAAVVGDLTLRGIKQELIFLAEIDIQGAILEARASGVRVDRTVHDAKYGSARFFRDLGRKIVSDDFTLDIQVKASR